MKTIYLLRHAKSSWSGPETDDFDRPLNERGRRNAAEIGQYLAKNDVRPDVILCSVAARAQETLSIIRPFLPENQKIKIDKELYLASSETLRKYLENIDESVNSVMIVAHNPGLHELALMLGGRENIGTSALLNRVMLKFPTAAFATVGSEAHSWSKLSENKTKLTDFVCPKDLRSQYN